MALFLNYNLEIEKYKEKYNLLTLNLSSETRLQDGKVLDTHPAWLKQSSRLWWQFSHHWITVIASNHVWLKQALMIGMVKTLF